MTALCVVLTLVVGIGLGRWWGWSREREAETRRAWAAERRKDADNEARAAQWRVRELEDQVKELEPLRTAEHWAKRYEALVRQIVGITGDRIP